MANVTRRQLLLGGSALLGAGMVPGGMMRALAEDGLPRPDYMIRAGTNENPWGPSRVALQAINEAMDLTNQYGGIREEMVALMGQQQDMPVESIVIGSGSGEILKTAGMIASMEQGSIVCADPTYQDLVRYAARAGSEIIRVPVNENLDIDLDAMASAIRPDTRLVYLVNPNNPIPRIIEKNRLRDFVLDVSKDRLVFVDEAYHEFVDNPDYGSMLPLIRDGHRNIVVSRTASKIHGLAGLRIGFGFAHPELIELIDNRKTGQINILGLHAAYASYQDEEFQKFTLRKNKESLAIVEGMFEELGLRYVKSNANFTFFETGIPVEELNAALRAENIYSGRPFPPYLTWSRISMAKPAEMRYYVQTYKKLFG
ncbi:MAG: histidinol-phosphate transaminase [Woeseiaceae bacterium]|nr:histidinol-phosphate transaminase [Woeseiaceae bacterium]